MAGIRHLIDTEAHKALFEELRAKFGDDVGAVIQALGEHNSASNAHGATPFPDPNTIMRRDEAGRVRVADPVHEKDVVNKGYVDVLGLTQFKVFTANGTFVSPKTGMGLVLLIGGGQGGNNGAGRATALAGEMRFFPWYFFAGASYRVIVGAGGAGGAAPQGIGDPVYGQHGGHSNFAGNISRGGGRSTDAGYRGFVAVAFGLPDVYSRGGVTGNYAAAQAGIRGYGAPGGYGGVTRNGGGITQYIHHDGGAGAPGLCVVFY